jgi:hypothetical protein
MTPMITVPRPIPRLGGYQPNVPIEAPGRDLQVGQRLPKHRKKGMVNPQITATRINVE